MDDFWIARTPTELRERVAYFMEWCDENSVYPVAWKAEKYKGAKRMEQRSLFHIWVRQMAAKAFHAKKPTEQQQYAMKVWLLKQCYAETGWPWLIVRVPDQETGEIFVARASTELFDRGQMHQLMSWVQRMAADRGQILESIGEYQELQAAQNA